MSSMQVIQGERITLPQNSFIAPNSRYHFAGWYESTECTGTKYEAGQKIQINSDKELYAKWELNMDKGIIVNGKLINSDYSTVTSNVCTLTEKDSWTEYYFNNSVGFRSCGISWDISSLESGKKYTVYIDYECDSARVRLKWHSSTC